MGLDMDAAFAVIQRALEDFSAGVDRASAEQARAQETIGSVEYEMDELRKLIAETALPADEKQFEVPRPDAGALGSPEALGRTAGSGLARRLVAREA